MKKLGIFKRPARILILRLQRNLFDHFTPASVFFWYNYLNQGFRNRSFAFAYLDFSFQKLNLDNIDDDLDYSIETTQGMDEQTCFALSNDRYNFLSAAQQIYFQNQSKIHLFLKENGN